MILSSTSLDKITYPVFRLGVHKPIIENGVVFYYYEREVEGVVTSQYKLVDDKNIDKPTLALRRLQLSLHEVPLYRIDQAIFFLGDLIKIATPHTWFIDSNGKVFKYDKATRAKLCFYLINRNIPINTGGAIIEAKGVPTRFKSLYPPSVHEKYVGLLHFGKSIILYGFYTEKFDDTWRLV